MDRDYREWAWEYYQEEEARLRAAVVSVLRRNNDWREDDIMSDVVLRRLPGLLRTWDPDKGASLNGHVVRGIKWWAYKSLCREDIRRNRFQAAILDSDHREMEGVNHHNTEVLNKIAHDSEGSQHELVELVAVLEAALERRTFVLLRRRYVENYTLDELAEKAHCSRALICHRLACAEAEVRELLAEEMDE